MYLIAATPWFLNPAQWLVILQVAVGLGFVIFVHELGHFLVAKACGVKCEKFYLGFDIYGLKLLKFQWGETEYGIGILPLGGYVKMLGQDDNPARMADETRRAQLQKQQVNASAGGSPGAGDHAPPLTHGDLPSEPVSDPHAPYDPRSYMAQSVPKRMAIISAGVIMNVIFAFILATIAYMIGVHETPCIVGGTAVGGAAWSADLQPGDTVLKIGSVENPRFRDLQTGVSLGDAKEGIPFTIRRASDGREETIVLHPDATAGIPIIGITSAARPKLIDESDSLPTVKWSPAREAAKFDRGDTLLQINELPIHSYRDVDAALARYVNQPIEVTVERKPPKPAQGDPPENGADRQIAPQKAVVKVEPTIQRDFGLIMPLGAIAAVQKDSPADKAGLKIGDRIVSLDGQNVGNPLTLETRLQKLAGGQVQVEVERKVEGAVTMVPMAITPRVPEFTDVLYDFSPLPISSLGVTSEVSPTVASVQPNSPAAAADVRPGDELISVKVIVPEKSRPDADEDETLPSKTIEIGKGKGVSWPALISRMLIFLDPETNFRFEVKRGDKTHKIELKTIDLTDELGIPVHSSHRGFTFEEIREIHKANSLGDALRLGKQEAIDNLLLVYRFLQRIGQGKISFKMTAGPLGIAEMAGAKAKEGFPEFLIFLTMLSANLAVLNFLPIPLLDGGHMVFLIYEGIRRKPASERVIIAFTYAGLILLLTLMLFVLGLDLGLISRR